MRANRRERAGRRQRRAETPLLKVPFRHIRNPRPAWEFLDEEDIEKLHRASLDILENIGLDFFDDEALDLWGQAGARVDHTARHVWLDRGLVLELIAKAPPSFTWRGRNPNYNMPVGGDVINFLPIGGMVYASNLDTGRRPGTTTDYENLLKLIQMCNVLHGAGVMLVELHDVNVSLRHLRRLLLEFTLTDKPVMEAAHGRIIPTDALNIARLVFGDSALDDPTRPVIGGIINVNSPLRYDERMLGGLITFARAGQATIMTPFILAGAMSPISIAAAVAQQNAEVLAGVALTQLVQPGAPVMYGGFSTNVDMKSGSPAFGTPEGAWVQVVGAQLARRYNLPCRGNGGLNNANLPDAQAAYEAMWTLWPAVLAHTNFIYHAAGWLEAGLTVSYEKLMIDMESLAMFQHFLAGFEITEETLALDMMAEVGPGGHHFGTAHTQARFSTEFYQPFLSSRLAFEPWQAAGSWDMAKRAHALWKEMLAQYEPPPIDPAIKEAVEDYVAQREQELEGVELYY